jgi:hypothetical protein
MIDYSVIKYHKVRLSTMDQRKSCKKPEHKVKKLPKKLRNFFLEEALSQARRPSNALFHY